MVQVAFVQSILQLIGRSQGDLGQDAQIVLGREFVALRVAELVPVGVLLELGLLLGVGLLETVQLGIERLAQQVNRLVQQRAYRVRLGQQAALSLNRIHLGLDGRIGAQGHGVRQQLVQLAPHWQALGNVVGGLSPGLGQPDDFVVAGEQLQQLGVAALRLDGFDGSQLGRLGRRGKAASLGCLVAQLGQQCWQLGQLLLGLAGHSDGTEQRADLDQLRRRDVHALALEAGLGELGAVQALGIDGFGGCVESLDMPGCQQGVQRAIDGVTRPAVGRRVKVVADLCPFLAGADEGQQLLADRVLVGFLGMAHSLQGFEVALAGLVQHLAPHVVVGRIELAVEADGGGPGCTVDTVGQVVAVGGFLSTGLEDTHTCHQQVQQL